MTAEEIIPVERMSFFEGSYQLEMRGGSLDHPRWIYHMISFPTTDLAATSVRLVRNSMWQHLTRRSWADFHFQCECCNNAVWMRGNQLHVRAGGKIYSMAANNEIVQELHEALLDVVMARLGRIIDEDDETFLDKDYTFQWRKP